MARTCKYCDTSLEGERLNRKYCRPCALQRQKKQHKERYDKYYLWLKEKGCVYCNIQLPCCLEVHHLCKGSKRYSATARGQSEKYNREDVINEIAVVLCANCHRTFHRHWGGNGRPFPDQTEESTMNIIELEYNKWELSSGGT